jgi:hypothetical protein
VTARNPTLTAKTYPFAPSTLAAIENLRALDPDLSESQAVARALRILDKTYKGNMPADLLEKYERHELLREEYYARREADLQRKHANGRAKSAA